MQDYNKLNKLVSSLDLEEFNYDGNSESVYYKSPTHSLYIFEFNPKKKNDIAIHKLNGGVVKENGNVSTYRKYLQTRINQILEEDKLQEAFRKLDNLIRQEINLNYLDEKSYYFKIHKYNMRIDLGDGKSIYADKSDIKSMSLEEFKVYLKGEAAK
ncbi:hypothetical protein GO491_04490 [Flavobacteriaceae bacterium Ap0902]|nr:hypothetical protein [Flavobacteriaceae bacterium Ap0902]